MRLALHTIKLNYFPRNRLHQGILFRDYNVAMEAGRNSLPFVMHNLNSQNVAVLQFKYFRFECEKRVHAVSREFKCRDVQIRKTKREKVAQ